MIAGVRLLVSSFHVCDVAVSLSVLLNLAMVLLTRVAGMTPAFFLVVSAW